MTKANTAAGAGTQSNLCSKGEKQSDKGEEGVINSDQETPEWDQESRKASWRKWCGGGLEG